MHRGKPHKVMCFESFLNRVQIWGLQINHLNLYFSGQKRKQTFSFSLKAVLHSILPNTYNKYISLYPGKTMSPAICRLINCPTKYIFSYYYKWFFVVVFTLLLLFSHSVMSDSLWSHGLQHPASLVLHCLPELAHTHAYWVGDAI